MDEKNDPIAHPRIVAGRRNPKELWPKQQFASHTRKEHYVRRLEERTLQKGDRVAVLGRGIAVVNQVDNRNVLAVLGSGLGLRIVRRDIVMNQQNRRWECGIRS